MSEEHSHPPPLDYEPAPAEAKAKPPKPEKPSKPDKPSKVDDIQKKVMDAVVKAFDDLKDQFSVKIQLSNIEDTLERIEEKVDHLTSGGLTPEQQKQIDATYSTLQATDAKIEEISK